ncbi:MAG: hypothetical protein JRN18_03670 [Nitrososphaerota archaeon]|nr:hypothetical protein [Nitrososphaerota archaeon]MDG6916962.1 hypothetical protein [Nitrososphaerota archaeon]MDG6919097.1 hypothetical protein [Nitrososphaerota archaeon]
MPGKLDGYDVWNDLSDWYDRMGGPQTVYSKVKIYREQYHEEVPWNKGDRTKVCTVSYHRPLNWCDRALCSKDMAITALEELEPAGEFIKIEQQDEDLDDQGVQEVPLHPIIEAAKL